MCLRSVSSSKEGRDGQPFSPGRLTTTGLVLPAPAPSHRCSQWSVVQSSPVMQHRHNECRKANRDRLLFSVSAQACLGVLTPHHLYISPPLPTSPMEQFAILLIWPRTPWKIWSPWLVTLPIKAPAQWVQLRLAVTDSEEGEGDAGSAVVFPQCWGELYNYN